jgi:hypothetical protein
MVRVLTRGLLRLDAVVEWKCGGGWRWGLGLREGRTWNLIYDLQLMNSDRLRWIEGECKKIMS